MSEAFVFDSIDPDNLESFIKSAFVFNYPKDMILGEVITLSAYESEELGSSIEHLDVFVYSDGKWQFIPNLQERVAGVTTIHLCELIQDVDFTRVLIIVRRLSSFVFDKKDSNFVAYVLCKCLPEYDQIHLDRPLFGLLAKSQVYLDRPNDDVRKQIEEKVINRDKEICDRLFLTDN